MGTAMGSARTQRGRFGRRLAAITVVLAVLPAIAVGWRLIAVNDDALEDADRELLFAVVDDVSHAIDAQVAVGRGELDAIAHAIGSATAGGDRAATLGAVKLLAASGALPAVGFYDEHGQRFEVVRRTGADTSELPAHVDCDGAIAGVVLPLYAHAGAWCLYAPLPLGAIDARLAELARDRFAKDLEAVFVVDQAQRLVAHPDPERPRGVVMPIAKLPTHQQLMVFTRDGDHLGVVRSLPSAPLAVVTQLPVSRAFASIGRMRLIVLGVVGLAVVIAGLSALLFARRTSAPIGRLVEFAGELAARRFDAKLDVHTGDELETLGVAMQSAAGELSRSEAKLLEEATIRSDLGRYLPRQLVDKVLRREQSFELGGDRRIVTVLFADVASFTTLTESKPPEVVVGILNQLFTLLSEIVFRHGGTIDKYIGDSVMAFWNAPDLQDDHAARAIATAADMLAWLEIANEAWRAKHGVTIHLAIGVNTGEVVVGNFGSEHRMTYTCIGDPVNVASRLEGLARPQQILVSKSTRDAAAKFSYGPLGSQTLLGRLEPVEVFEVVS